MKSSEEMVSSLLQRRERYMAEQNQKRKTAIRIAVPVFSVCLVALVCLAVWRAGSRKLAPDAAASGENAARSIIWAQAETDSHDEGFTVWNGKNVTFRLLEALETGEEGSVYAVSAGRVVDPDFVFQGKTIAEYDAEMWKERDLPELLAVLLKVGDSLKYGAALYETGTPDGEKWSREWYETTVDSFGSELLETYIVNGEFLREKAEKDMAAAREKTEARTAYLAAVEAYYARLPELLPDTLSPERIPGKNSVLLYLTEDEFAALTVDAPDQWTFDLAFRNEEAIDE